MTDIALASVKYYRFARGKLAGASALISRTGYTGEDGFELYVPWNDTERVWTTLLDAGKPIEAAPIGLGARDTLRLEMRYALYGNDIDATTNPLEAGLGWVVKPAKGDFIGNAAIERMRAEGPRRRLVGIEMADRSVARHGYAVLSDGRRIGEVTSGSYGPSVEKSIALAYIETPLAAVGTAVDVEIRGQRFFRQQAASAALTRTDWEIAFQEITFAVNAVNSSAKNRVSCAITIFGRVSILFWACHSFA